MRHETAIFGPIKTKTRNSSYHFFTYSFLFQQPKLAETPTLWCFSKPKKDIFQNLNSKHRKLGTPIFAPFLQKRLFWENWQIIGHKKSHKMITEQKQITWNHYKYRSEMTLAQLVPLNLAQLVMFRAPNLAQLITSQHIYMCVCDIYIYICVCVCRQMINTDENISKRVHDQHRGGHRQIYQCEDIIFKEQSMNNTAENMQEKTHDQHWEEHLHKKSKWSVWRRTLHDQHWGEHGRENL